MIKVIGKTNIQRRHDMCPHTHPKADAELVKISKSHATPAAIPGLVRQITNNMPRHVRVRGLQTAKPQTKFALGFFSCADVLLYMRTWPRPSLLRCSLGPVPVPFSGMDALLEASKVRPLSYDITLALCAPPRAYFEGNVTITILVAEPVSMFLLHSSGLSISSACFLPSGIRASCHQASRDVIVVSTGGELVPGTYYLRLCFGGSVRVNRTDGIYACTWRHDRTSWIIGTHFEPGHCRSAFPCFDQPHFKATFALTIITPDSQAQALSNTEPEFSTTDTDFALSRLDAGGSTLLSRLVRQSLGSPSPDGRLASPGPTYRVTKFHPTPLVATYVLGFWVGHFSSLSSRAKHPEGITITFFLPPVPHLMEEAAFSRDITVRAYDFFADLFALPLPLRKLDVICLPRMHGVGMEGFGAVTIMQDYLLVGPNTDFARKRRIARLLCHEVSHQWLGDLVTPLSFDELWLKESTARLFEYMAVDGLEPSWHVWPNFVTEVTYSAMHADALPSSHAVIQHHHGDLRSIIESFDVITYGKGASVLRMLCHHLGVQTFINGVRRFIHAFQFRNACMTDLWAALEAECQGHQQGSGSVGALMEPWLTRAGVPALHVDVWQGGGENGQEGGYRLVLTQRALRMGPGTPPAAPPPSMGPIGAHHPHHPPPDHHPQANDGPHTTVCDVDGVDPSSSRHQQQQQQQQQQRCIPLRLRLGRGNAKGKEKGCTHKTHTLNLLVGEGQPLILDLSPYLTTGGGGGGAAGQGMGPPQQQQPEEEPWMVVNSNHAGYFATMYDSPLAWAMARAGVTGGHTCDTEAVGLVCDLMLATQAALKAPSSSSSSEAEALAGTLPTEAEAAGGTPRCSSSRGRSSVGLLQGRLQELVHLWRSEGAPGGVPAWLVGQLFLWEVKMMSLGREVEVAERRYCGVEETAFGWAHPPSDPPLRGPPDHHEEEEEMATASQRTAAAMGVAHEVLSEVTSVCQAVESMLHSPLSPSPCPLALAPLLSEHLVKAKAVRSRLLAITSRLTSAAACHPSSRLSPPPLLPPHMPGAHLLPSCAVQHNPAHPLTVATHRSPTASLLPPLNSLRHVGMDIDVQPTTMTRPAALESLAQAACAGAEPSSASSPPTPPYPSTHPNRVYT